KPASGAHLLGTDDLGRDVLARVIWGTRISIQAGVLSIVLAMAVGVPAGLAAGYYRGAVDQLLMRLTDAWLAFPFLILAIGLVTILGPSLANATLAIGLGATPTFIRLARGLVLAAREEDYVQGARALGAGDARVMGRHVLPNVASAILVQATVSIPAAIIAEAVLSFLGLGVQPPAPSWGTMLNAAQQFLDSAPWMAWWPGLAIFLLTLSFNLAGDGIRDALDPKDTG
ncbi:MAG: diguanylate cyclase, partial [Candidatus Rokuibacteriota bacterium]